uniref:Uncharacterized protein n=1 Tax=Graphocephala atropunctata TaxID=36148 RepID=A0A1B6KM43_9HEMI
MGKIRRERQKLHQSSRGKQGDVPVAVGEEWEQKQLGKSPLLKSAEELAAIPDNLFQGIDINFDSLKQKLAEDDRVSVRSVAKSCKFDSKGKLLTKKEKQKLKHDLFMRKINTAEQLKKEALQKHKKRKALRKSDVKMDTSLDMPADTNLDVQKSPGGLSEICTKKVKNLKPKGIKKAKVRQREMLQEVSSFRKILVDLKHAEDPQHALQLCLNKMSSEIPSGDPLR